LQEGRKEAIAEDRTSLSRRREKGEKKERRGKKTADEHVFDERNVIT